MAKKERRLKWKCKECGTAVAVGQRTKHLRENHSGLGKDAKSKDYFVLNPKPAKPAKKPAKKAEPKKEPFQEKA